MGVGVCVCVWGWVCVGVCGGKWGGPHVSPHIFLLPPAFAISHFPLLTQHTYTHNEHKKTDNKPTTHTSYTHTHNSHNIYNKHETHTHNTENTVHTALSPNSPCTLQPPGDAEDAEDVEDAGCWNLWKTSPNIKPRSRLSTSFPNKRFHLHFCHNFGRESFFLVMNFQRLMGLFSTLSNI